MDGGEMTASLTIAPLYRPAPRMTLKCFYCGGDVTFNHKSDPDFKIFIVKCEPCESWGTVPEAMASTVSNNKKNLFSDGAKNIKKNGGIP
jgi:hypothetical protein